MGRIWGGFPVFAMTMGGGFVSGVGGGGSPGTQWDMCPARDGEYHARCAGGGCVFVYLLGQ